jgi:hypothetical protein
MNQAAKGFIGFGIVAPNGGRNYTIKLDGERVDLTDFTQLGRAMNQRLAGSPNNPFLPRRNLRDNAAPYVAGDN